MTDLAIGGHQEVMTYCHRNQQYSVTELTNASGTIVERYAYTAYGQPKFFDGSGTTITSSAENNRYTYTGREWDEDLHLYHYRARMYDAVAGRFVSRDPIGYVDANSLYLFVLSAPLANLDPFGEKTNDCRRSHDECCADYLNANPDVTKDGVLGKVVCCDGRPVPCVFLGIDTDPRDNETPKLDKATELIAECIKKHEENHILHYPGGCDDNAKGNLYPRFRPREEKDRSECLAYKRSLRCLKSAYRRCQKLPQCNSDDIDRHLRDNRERVAYHCSRARIEF